jgi:hypothetical protein
MADEQPQERSSKGRDDQAKFEQRADEGRKELEEFEQQEELPGDLKKWPSGKGKFVTFAEDEDEPYGEGKTAKLGPPLTYHDDGSVTIDGEKVDNPDDYKSEPIPLAVEQNPDEPRKQEQGSEAEHDEEERRSK